MANKAAVSSNNRSALYLFFSLVFFFIFILSLLTPMVSDDFAYSFSWADWTRIKHVMQIIPSMAVHRNVTNGRVFVHALVQLFLLLPRFVFCFLNAINAVLLFVMIRSLLLDIGLKHQLVILSFSAFYFCCFLPAFGENCLWLDGSINYSWGITCSLLFLLPFLFDYLGIPSHENKMCRFLRFILAFFLGSWSENASLVTLFLAVCLWLLYLKHSRRFCLFPFLWIITAFLGYLFLMTAPSTVGRAGASSISVIGYNFRLIFQAAKTYLIWPLLIYSVLFALSLYFNVKRNIILLSALLMFGALSALFSYVFAAYFVPRHICFTVFLMLLATVLLALGLCQNGYPAFLAVALSCLSVLFFLQFPVGCLDVAISYHKQQLREEQIFHAMEVGNSEVTLENYYPYTGYAVPFELNPSDSTVGPNVNIADYYGLEAVYGIDPPVE